jgi:hypothetical protein
MYMCHNLNLGLTTKARACKVAGQERKPGSERKCEGMNPHTPKGAFTLRVGVSMDSRMFKEWLQMPKFNRLRSCLYHWKKLKHRCLKWVCMTHLDIWNTSYGQKKARESNWQFDSRQLKVKNRPYFLTCRWHATYCWKDLDKGYNFASDLISIGGLHAKLWGPKIEEVPPLGISGFPFGSPGTKMPFGCGFCGEAQNIL